MQKYCPFIGRYIYIDRVCWKVTEKKLDEHIRRRRQVSERELERTDRNQNAPPGTMKSATTNGDWLVLNDLYTSLKAFCICEGYEFISIMAVDFANIKTTRRQK